MENNYLIYSIEDDPNISHLINIALSKQGYIVKSFIKFSEFAEEFNKAKPNMILLDLMLPEISGEEILKKIRENEKYDDIEIIIISAKNLTINKVDGLDLGADDYLSKPFDVLELISRVNARSRRHLKKKKSTIRGYYFDTKNKILSKNGEEVNLTNGEAIILFELFKNVGNVVKREDLFVALWGEDTSYETRILDAHIKEIRRKLGPNKDLIETIYGSGYKLKNE
jgi:two-component system, OmpR family, alkaline phosphatase synthesis response regulator PhoP